EFGLFRFDGVQAVAWQPPADQHLPSSNIVGLLAARDGTLWIGTLHGLASWNRGRLTEYPQLADQSVFRLLEDREGALWAGGIGSPNARLCVIGAGNVRCFGDDARFGRGVMALYQDRQGDVWLGVRTGIWRWKPDSQRFYAVPSPPDGIQGFARS